MMKGSPISSAAFFIFSPPLKSVATSIGALARHKINKVSEMLGHGLARNVAPGLNFLSDIFGNVVCPMLQSIERYNANRIIDAQS